MYYQNHIMNLSRESGLDTIGFDHAGAAAGAQTAHRDMDSLDSHDSISRYVTCSTAVLFRRDDRGER